jgi:hypothetical protein
MEILGVGIMNSTDFSPSSKSNSKIDGNQVNFGTMDFQPHPPTLAPVLAKLDQEMDLTIGSFNFRVGSLGSIRLSDPIYLGLSAGKTAAVATSTTLVGSSSEVNSPVSIEPTKRKENTIEELDEIMKNLDPKKSSGYSDMASEGNSDDIGSYFEEDFIVRYGNVSGNSEDMWRSGLELYDDEQTIFSSGSSHGTSNRHQVCVIINDTSTEFDIKNNPVINSQNLERGTNNRAEGETESAVTTREKVHLTDAEWQTIKAAVNHVTVILPDSTWEVLMGYQYALHQQKKRLLQEKSKIRRRRKSTSVVSRLL